MESLIVRTTDGNQFMYEGKDAVQVFNGINGAGARGAEWTTPTKLESGYEVVFILKNIVTFQFKK